jgi:hypothetical protein
MHGRPHDSGTTAQIGYVRSRLKLLVTLGDLWPPLIFC